MIYWYLAFHHGHTGSIRCTLKKTQHQDANSIQKTVQMIRFQNMQDATPIEKNYYDHLPVVTFMVTDVDGSIVPTDINTEPYLITFTDVVSILTFSIPVQTRAYVL